MSTAIIRLEQGVGRAGQHGLGVLQALDLGGAALLAHVEVGQQEVALGVQVGDVGSVGLQLLGRQRLYVASNLLRNFHATLVTQWTSS